MNKFVCLIVQIMILSVFLFCPEQSRAESASMPQIADQAQLDQLLVTLVTANPENRLSALSISLKAMPAATEQLVATSLAAGYEHEDIAHQCLEDLKLNQIKTIVRLLLRDQADLEEVLSACLPGLPAENVSDVMTLVFQEVGELQLDFAIQYALSVLEAEGLDGRSLLVTSLAGSGVLGIEGVDCANDCLRPIADNFISGFGTEEVYSSGEAADDEPADDEPSVIVIVIEPALSGS